MNIDIPEGNVFVPRFYSDDRNQAAELLEAADAAGVDQTEVRTGHGGFIVPEAVAAEWQKGFEAVDGIEPVAPQAPESADTSGGLQVTDPQQLKGGESDPSTGTAGEHPQGVGADGATGTVEVEAEAFPEEAWSHADIDAYAEKYELSYDGIEAKNAEKPTKAEKVAHLLKVAPKADVQNADGSTPPVDENGTPVLSDGSTPAA